MNELAPWNYWNQLDDWTADGRADENRANNCGWECVAMVAKYVTGVEMPADYLKDRVYGESYTGYAYAWDMASALGRWAEIPARAHWQGPTELPQLIRRSIDDGRPIILLVRFQPQATQTHWIVAVGYDDASVIVADPWGGQRREIAWGDLTGVWYRGWVVEVLRRRCMEVVDG